MISLQSTLSFCKDAITFFGGFPKNVYLWHADRLEAYEPERLPYLAIPKDAYNDLIREPIIQVFLDRHNMHLIIFDTTQSIIYQWKK